MEMNYNTNKNKHWFKRR